MYCQIYKITNKINGKIYVGQTWQSLKQRFAEHCSKGAIGLGQAIVKYGRDNFSMEFIILAHTQEIADYWEEYFIAKLKSNCRGIGYNIERGGKGRGKMSEESKTKLRLANLGKTMSEATKQKISRKLKGQLRTEEAKLRIANAQKSMFKKNRKLNAQLVLKVREDFANGKSLGELAIEYSVSKSLICNVVNNKIWK